MTNNNETPMTHSSFSLVPNPYANSFKGEYDRFSDLIMDVIADGPRDDEPSDDDNAAHDEWLDRQQGLAIIAYFESIFPNTDAVYTGHGYEIQFQNPPFTEYKGE